MPIDYLVKQCSPTLAGLKTGSLFSYCYSDRDNLNNELREINRVISKKGLRMIPLKIEDNRALIYIWRIDRLDNDLKDSKACELLSRYGYTLRSSQGCINQLISRLNCDGEFPHEIGLFLGYPPEDVEGFIENNAKCYLCCGTWKVYGDSEKASNVFESYKRCEEIYTQKVKAGVSLEELTV